MKRLNSLVAALAVAIPMAASAAVSIQFDADGAGAAYAPSSVITFDWKPGSALSLLGNGVTDGSSAKLLYQANLGTVTDTNGDTVFSNGENSAGGKHFFTAVAGFWETAHLTSPTATNASFTFDSVSSGAGLSSNNFFYIYAQNASGANLAGTGFVGTAPILSAHVVAVNSSNFTYTLDSKGNPVIQTLDQFNGDSWGGTQTAVGSGSTDLVLVIDSVNAAYFPDLLGGSTLSLGMTNTSQVDPFQQADPSKKMSTDGVTGANHTVDVGPINGFNLGTAKDFIFQADANLSFDRQPIPEPGSIALIGIALAAAGVAGRRRRA